MQKSENDRTYKQLSEEWGITKPTIKSAKNRVESDLIKNELYMVGNTVWITQKGQELIKGKLCHAPSVPTGGIQDTAESENDSKIAGNAISEIETALIDALKAHIATQQEQLKAKDSQIAELLSSVKAAQMLQASTQQQLEALKMTTAAVPEQKVKTHWWNRNK